MPQFVFQLQGVLRHREMIEQQCLRDLAAVQADYAVVLSELRALDETVGNAVADLRNNRLIGPLNMQFIAAHRRFVLGVQRKAQIHLEKLQALQKRVDAAKSRLNEAVKQKKIIEKLRDKQHAAWLQEFARKELAGLDEVMMQMTAAACRDDAQMTEEAVGAHS
jgi:flagellar FliJ protein